VNIKREDFMKRKRKTAVLPPLPNYILPLPNPDKSWHESWTKNRNLLNLPHPFRLVAFGPPGVGKSTIIKNILLRSFPVFERVTVLHVDPENSREWQDLGDDGVEIRGDIPSPDSWDDSVKHLVICDDLDVKQLGKEQSRALDRMFGYASTHRNISICLTAQDSTNVPPSIKRCANVFILWKMPDIDAMSRLAKQSGMKAKEMRAIFDTFDNFRDSLWIDLTPGTPYRLRKNGFIELRKQE
jgi:DNA polymerase III delta prime subunit